VFEVLIKGMDRSDPQAFDDFRKQIVTKTINDVTYIPLECVQAGTDSIPFVYTKSGNKQIVVIGESNENNVVVEQGLEPGTVIYLSSPEDTEKFKIAGEDLIAVNRERAKAKKEEEIRLREEAAKANQRPPMMEGITPEMIQQFQNMRGNPSQGGAAGRTRDTAAMGGGLCRTGAISLGTGGVRTHHAGGRINREPVNRPRVRMTSNHTDTSQKQLILKSMFRFILRYFHDIEIAVNPLCQS
jgi:hypothetical protein